MRSNTWLAIVALVGTIVVGMVAYNVGVTQGAAQAAAAGGNLPPYAYGWGYRPWGFGFGFPIFLLLFFWFFLARAFFWRGMGPRHGWGPDRSRFDAWHREAHQRMESNGTAHQS